MQYGRKGAPKWPTDLGTLRFFGRSCQLLLNKFFAPSTPSMREVDDREKKRKELEKIMSFMVATNVVASQPPKRQLTGTPTDRAKMSAISNLLALKNAT